MIIKACEVDEKDDLMLTSILLMFTTRSLAIFITQLDLKVKLFLRFVFITLLYFIYRKLLIFTVHN